MLSEPTYWQGKHIRVECSYWKSNSIITFVHWAIKKAASPICSLLDEVGQGKGKHLIFLLGSSPEHLTFTLEKRRSDPAGCPRLRHLLPNVIMSYTALYGFIIYCFGCGYPGDGRPINCQCSTLGLDELWVVTLYSSYSAVVTTVLQITIILFKECRKERLVS